MNETFNIQGIILKRDDFRETDSRVLVYSLERGLLELVVRGTKRMKSKLAAHIEPISLTEIMVIRGKNYDYVGSALARNCFRNLKENYNKIISAGSVLRRVGEVIRVHEVDENIFFLLVDFLNNLNLLKKEIDDDNLFVEFFIFKLMPLLGYQPVLETCLVCGQIDQSRKIFFNVKKGGLMCERCSGISSEGVDYNVLISPEAVKTLLEILENDFENIFKLKIEKNTKKEIAGIIHSFEKYHLN